jgi:hypothetical protein
VGALQFDDGQEVGIVLAAGVTLKASFAIAQELFADGFGQQDHDVSFRYEFLKTRKGQAGGISRPVTEQSEGNGLPVDRAARPATKRQLIEKRSERLSEDGVPYPARSAVQAFDIGGVIGNKSSLFEQPPCGFIGKIDGDRLSAYG